MTTILDRIDPAVAAAIENENRRQRDSIVLIASENYASKAVLEAQAQLMNNKYAEGYPGRRYYGGCEFVDVVETLAIDRAKELSARNTPTCKLTAAPRPTWPPTSPSWSRATPCWVCSWTWADT